MNFGTMKLGKQICIKINAKLSEKESKEFQDAYPDLLIKPIGKGLTRIEGAISPLLWNECCAWELKLACKRSKRERLDAEIIQMEEAMDHVYARADDHMGEL